MQRDFLFYIVRAVIRAVCRESFFLQLAVCVCAQEREYDCEYGNAYQSAEHAEDAPADCYRENNPECFQTYAVAHDSGADHLSVKLLKHNGDYAEYKGVGGAYDQEQNSAYHRADYRTEHGNEIKNTYHNGDKLRIFYAENKQEDIV